MKQIIQTTLFFGVLAIITIYSNSISGFIVENYNSAINYLVTNLTNTIESLAF